MEEISHGEISRAEDVSNSGTSRFVDARSSDSDSTHSLDSKDNMSETMSPVGGDTWKAKEGRVFGGVSDVHPIQASKEGRVSGGVSDVHPIHASDATTANCTCPDINEDAELTKSCWIRYLGEDDGHCVKLVELLERNPCLLAISSGTTGNTVLHVAAEQGCLKLLVHICNLFLDESGHMLKEFVHCDKKIDREDFFQKANRMRITATDLLWLRLGEKSMYNFFKEFEGSKPSKHHPGQFQSLAYLQDEVFDPLCQEQEHYLPMSKNYCETDAMRVKRLMKETVIKVSNDHKELLEDFRNDRNYDFVAEYEELQFHYAFEHYHSVSFEEWGDYMKAVVRGCVKEGPDVVKCLFNYRNAQGKTIMHCGTYQQSEQSYKFYKMLREEVPDAEEYKGCFDGRNTRGWTALHCAAAADDNSFVQQLLLMGTRVDVNATLVGVGGGKATALHLAILHNHMDVVHTLLQHEDVDVNAILTRHIRPIGCQIHYANLEQWTPLQLAVMLRRQDIVTALLDNIKVEDPGFQKEKFVWRKMFETAKKEELHAKDSPRIFSAIHLAGIIGDPNTLRCFFNVPTFNLSVTIQGCTALHFVVYGSPLEFVDGTKCLLKKTHICNKWQLGEHLSIQDDLEHAPSDKDKEACISILIQGGLDVWQKNDYNKFPEPGPHASIDLRHAWQQKLLSETQDAKNNLNNAGNAISVVSALVATASYVGPLQPPLGLDSNTVQDTSLPIRIYMVTNTMSFYMSVASIIFAVVVSLPMPQEGIYDEWQRSRKTIILAIHLLLLAVMNVLISFGAASNVVMSSEYSWQHRGLVFYPTVLGGLLCVVAICLFYLRLFRLTFVKNVPIKLLYHFVFKAPQNEKMEVKIEGNLDERRWHMKRTRDIPE